MSRMFEWKNPYVPGSPRARVAESKRQEVRKEREKKVRCEAAVQQILRSPAERESAELDLELLQVEQQQRVLVERQALLDQERIDLKHARDKVEKEQAQIEGARKRFEDKASSYRFHQALGPSHSLFHALPPPLPTLSLGNSQFGPSATCNPACLHHATG
ncbi:hypothetical protein CYMTET_55502 [Cymbomonas tetramitiformis]|uniref:Uncharacterized protein n=1 Tax=Cymbomonas tetramitiformis TaxID=36881 RepID=A0AAE0BEP1_9CHLO|nr:hypothetical protein CYMTET_55502 [Cymbomonas tetramitiformis]